MTQRPHPLEIGTRIRLRPLDDGATVHMTRVEDVSEQWLAVQRPTHNYQPVRLYPGTLVELHVVRTHPPEGIYRAETSVLGETRQRPPLVRLRWPEQWERTQLREYFRVPVSRPVRVRALDDVDGDEPWIEGVSRDLSGGGCQIVVPAPLEHGQSLEIELDLPDGTFRLRGTVKRVQRPTPAQGSSVVAGIMFQDVPDRQREELIRYAFERQIELRRKGVT